MDKGLHIAMGMDYLGMKIPRPFNVLYFNFELDKGIFESRLRELLEGKPKPDSFDYITLLGNDIPLLNTKEGKERIDTYLRIQALKGKKPEVVIFDDRWKMTEGDDNQSAVMHPFITNADDLLFDPAKIFIHHESQRSTGVGAGSSVWDRWLNSWAHQIANDWYNELPTAERKLIIRGNYGKDKNIYIRFNKPFFTIDDRPKVTWKSKKSQIVECSEFIIALLKAQDGELGRGDIMLEGKSEGYSDYILKASLKYLKEDGLIEVTKDTSQMGNRKVVSLKGS